MEQVDAVVVGAGAGGGNPCLTIQALAYWVSDHIVRAWKGGGLNG
jgi:hypothetical protein